MSHFHPTAFLIIIISLIFSFLPQLPALPVLPNPDPSTLQQQQTFHPNPSSPATIPSFPEQSVMEGCPLQLPLSIVPAVKSSCGGGQRLSRGKCCPVLAAWLYSAYADTALGDNKAGVRDQKKKAPSSYDLPLLPDDSETCVDGLEKAMRDKGVKLERLNATCDVVYCYCGIRLHQLSCPQAFHMSEDGKLVGDHRVTKLEKDCLSNNSNGGSKLARCSKCLNSLYSLKNGNRERGNATKLDVRTSKMHSRDCDLMGLTWLLKKDRDAYISTVTTVMRALMVNEEGSDPRSCSLNSDGMPLAVDSVELNGQSSSTSLQSPLYLYLSSIFLLVMSSSVLPYCF